MQAEPNRSIWALQTDSLDNLWVGAQHGLWRISPDRSEANRIAFREGPATQEPSIRTLAFSQAGQLIAAGGLLGPWDTPPFVDGGRMIAPSPLVNRPEQVGEKMPAAETNGEQSQAQPSAAATVLDPNLATQTNLTDLGLSQELVSQQILAAPPS